MKFIHLTDPHLMAPGVKLHGLDPGARLAACVRSIAEHHADAAFCVVTGDISDRGEAAAYALASEVLAALPMPVHVIPGNHDERAAFVHAFADAAVDENGFVQNAIVNPAGHFLLLDTVSPQHGSSGGYCKPRRDWLAARLQEAGDRPVYLFMHHPPFDVALPDLDAIGMVEHEKFAALVARAGNVRHLFFGHVHRPISGLWRGIGFSTLYGTNHQVRLDFHGCGRLAFTSEPPAYSVVLIEPDLILVHTHHYETDQSNIRED
jgi:3',5'-cyclic-AMP phosphodiesterase